MDILVLVESTSSAPATPDVARAARGHMLRSNACDTRCSGYRPVQPFGLPFCPVSFDVHVGTVGACLDLTDVHAVAHCRAGSVSELSMDWEAALGVLHTGQTMNLIMSNTLIVVIMSSL